MVFVGKMFRLVAYGRIGSGACVHVIAFGAASAGGSSGLAPAGSVGQSTDLSRVEWCSTSTPSKVKPGGSSSRQSYFHQWSRNPWPGHNRLIVLANDVRVM